MAGIVFYCIRGAIFCLEIVPPFVNVCHLVIDGIVRLIRDRSIHSGFQRMRKDELPSDYY